MAPRSVYYQYTSSCCFSCCSSEITWGCTATVLSVVLLRWRPKPLLLTTAPAAVLSVQLLRWWPKPLLLLHPQQDNVGLHCLLIVRWWTKPLLLLHPLIVLVVMEGQQQGDDDFWQPSLLDYGCHLQSHKLKNYSNNILPKRRLLRHDPPTAP